MKLTNNRKKSLVGNMILGVRGSYSKELIFFKNHIKNKYNTVAACLK